LDRIIKQEKLALPLCRGNKVTQVTLYEVRFDAITKFSVACCFYFEDTEIVLNVVDGGELWTLRRLSKF
jgi:hypothetical protein